LHHSIWKDFSHIKEHPALEGDKRCDVLVIGGGLAGILTAHFLKEAGIDCMIAEGGRILSGVTANTTAQITAQNELQYSKMAKSGAFKAKSFLHANLWAVEKYKEMAKDIECDLEIKDSYVFSLKDTKKIEEEVDVLEVLGYQAGYVDSLPLPLDVQGAYIFPKQAQFNPLMFAGALAEKLNIFENTFVREIKGNTAFAEKGVIKADRIVVATHFPFINTSGFYFGKMYQKRSYVLALEDGPDYDGMFVDQEPCGMYFRNYRNYLLVGGGDHRTGKKGGGFEELKNFSTLHYSCCPEKYHWATQDCITLDGLPYIGRYSNALPDVYVATGFNELGMTGSMLSARVLTERITGKDCEYGELFNPARSALHARLFMNLGESVLHLLSPATKRCTHLGCGLKWNAAEHTWDCPCHGSRFDEHGKVIENPATKNLKNPNN
jgi:glycine/D-amino acid oxidase-like deaminating enzyme